jgi:hypothetical protein
MHGDFVRSIARLIELTPESAEAEAEETKIRSKLLEALGTGGRQAAEALINSLSEDGFVLVHAKRGFWRVELPPPRVLEFWFNPPDDPISLQPRRIARGRRGERRHRNERPSGRKRSTRATRS